MALRDEILDLTRKARESSRIMGELPTRVKNAWLERSAERLEAARPTILEANERDMQEARK